MKLPAVFLDRDGTIMEEVGYCGRPADVHLIPGAADAIRRLRAAGFRIVIVTNQSGIGRGYYTVEDFHAVQDELYRQLGGRELIDATYYCPDHPEVEPARRKPAPDMLHDAARDLDLDLSRSYMVGDREGDITAGWKAGCQTILVLSGEVKDPRDTAANGIAPTIVEAADWILAHRLFTDAGHRLDTLRRVGEGDDSTAWLLNNRLICRVARSETARKGLRREASVLPQIAAKLPLAVPHPVFFEERGCSEHPYLPGAPFTLLEFQRLPGRDQQACLVQLADFLRELHACHPSDESLLTTTDYFERYGTLASLAAQYLFPKVDATARQWIEQALHDFYRQLQQPQASVLLHADLSPDHILWDRNAKRLTAIIDFGDMELGDPAWDLVYFWEEYDRAFVEAFLAAGRLPRELGERSQIFFHINTIEYAVQVVTGVRHDDIHEVLRDLQSLSRRDGR